MNSNTWKGHVFGALLFSLAAMVSFVVAPQIEAAESNPYVTTTLKGKLADPETDKPLVGAIIRFTGVEDGSLVEATTDEKGRFELSGLAYSSYRVEIETAEGERIQGINAIPINDDETVEIVLRISERVSSETMLDNQADRFVSAVQKKRVGWKRFWREFAIFWGVVIAGAAALL